MKAEKLTARNVDRISQAADIIYSVYLWSETPESRDWWREVCDKLRAIAENGTTDGKPWVEPVKPQSVDSTKPGFVMPDDWHWRKVDAINGRDIECGFRLLGWDPSGKAKQPYFVSGTEKNPYCVTDEEGWTFWVEHIRFTDGDTCDWSDDGTAEPC